MGSQGTGHVLGRYELVEAIGRGGMAVVWRGRHVSGIGLEAAIKVLHPEIATRPDQRESLRREARALARLRHPGIVRLLDFLETPKNCALVTELVPGRTLRRVLMDQEPEPLPLAAALRWMREALSAVAYAHQEGCLHRDLKPSNLMVTEEGAVRVLDFGIATLLDQQDAERPASGTPAYMAPEVAEGAAPSPAADVYALGVVLWETLTGHGARPFHTPGWRLGEAELALLAERGVPAPAVDLVRRMTAPDAAERFADAAVALAALSEVERQTADLAVVLRDGMPERAGGLLPPEAEGFHGRELDLDQLRLRFAQGARLITLRGPGGMGKTRLALRYAHEHAQSRPTWFADLGEARCPMSAATALAASFGFQLPGDSEPEAALARVGRVLAARGPVLVVLDNVEHLVPHATKVFAPWLRDAPEARFLLTSQLPLGLPDELVHDLMPLTQAEAIGLFLERARAVRPGYATRLADRRVVGEIVERLDRIPLAIELAAARAALLLPDALLERLDRRFELLRAQGGGRRGALRATLDWSWELLTPWEQAALAQCSVFRGGFTLEAAEEVLDLSALPEAPWVLDALESLRAKCWLRAVRMADLGEELRFDLYESVHAYASEKLGEQERAEVERRHARWYAEDGLLLARGVHRHGGRDRYRRLVLERDNLLLAFTRMRDRDPELAARAALAQRIVLVRRGSYEQASEVLDGAVACAARGADPALLVQALVARCDYHLPRCARQDEIEADLTRAGALIEANGLEALRGSFLISLGHLHFNRGEHDEAESCVRQAWEHYEAMGRPEKAAACANNIGASRGMLGRLEEAEALFREGLRLDREAGNRQGEATATGNLATLAADRGQLEEATSLRLRALALYRELGDRVGESVMLRDLAVHLVDLSRPDEAEAAARRALALALETGTRAGEVTARLALVLVHLALGEPEEAESALELAAQQVEGLPPEATITLEVRRAMLRLLQGRGDEAAALLAHAATAWRDAGNPRRARMLEVAAAALGGRPSLSPPQEDDAEDPLVMGLHALALAAARGEPPPADLPPSLLARLVAHWMAREVPA